MRNFSAPMGSLRSLRVLLLSLVAFLLIAVASVASASSAAAHAEWLGSSPEDGATVEVLPEALTLTFSSDLLNAEGATEVVVTDESGINVTVGSPVVEGPVVTQQLAPEASAGVYHVVWKVVYADGHPDAKEFSFTVTTGTAPTAEPSAPVEEVESAMPDASAPSATPIANAPIDAGTATVWVLLVVVAVALIVLVSVITIRKRHSADGPDSADDSAR